MIKDIHFRTFGVTDITPYSLVFLAAAVLIVFLLPRRYVLPAMLVPIFLISEWQRIVFSGFDFNIIRILILAGWARIFFRSELKGLQLNSIDLLISAWVLVSLVTHTLLYMTPGALSYKLGHVYTILGMYFLARFLIRDLDELTGMIKTLAVLGLVLAVFMIFEKYTMHNLLSVFGAPEMPNVRFGRVRSQAAFSHAILAGTFGASLLPVFISLWWQQEGMRVFAIVGVVAAFVMAYASGSSGPIITLAAGAGAMLLWAVRQHMRLLRWGVVLIAVFLELIMKAHVWFIISKVSVVSGSTAFHRALLIDRAIRFFNEWWLLGTKSTAHWGWGLQDTTNQFVRIGVDGGLLPLLLFIALISFSFQTIGRLRVQIELMPPGPKIFVWSIGATLFAHVVSFFGVSYFDQTIVLLVLLFAVIASFREYCVKVAVSEEQIPQPAAAAVLRPA